MFKFDSLKCSNFTFFLNYTFSMVEENFQIWLSEMSQSGLILLFLSMIPSPPLKKFLKFDLQNARKWFNFTFFAKQQQLVVGAEHIWQDQTHSKEISAKLTSIRIHCYECYFHLSKMAHFVHGTHISSGQLWRQNLWRQI